MRPTKEGTMEWYWIAVKNKVVVAALVERHYSAVALVKELRTMADSGPLERIHTAEAVTLGKVPPCSIPF